MVVCKYFLLGTCRFGNSCRYEHEHPRSKANNAGKSVLLQRTQVDPAQLLKSIRTDMTFAKEGKQWLLSSYLPFKDKPLFPGFQDYSFEEVRCGFYEAQATGNIDMYKHSLNGIMQTAVQNQNKLMRPTEEVVRIVRHIYITPAGQQHRIAPVAASNSSLVASTSNSMFPMKECGINNLKFGSQPKNNLQYAGATFPVNTGNSISFNASSKPSLVGPVDNGVSLFGGQYVSNPQQEQPQTATNFSSANRFIQQTEYEMPLFGFAPTAQPVFAPQPNVQTSSPSYDQTRPETVLALSELAHSWGGNMLPHTEIPEFDPSTCFSKVEELDTGMINLFLGEKFSFGQIPLLPPPGYLCDWSED